MPERIQSIKQEQQRHKRNEGQDIERDDRTQLLGERKRQSEQDSSRARQNSIPTLHHFSAWSRMLSLFTGWHQSLLNLEPDQENCSANEDADQGTSKCIRGDRKS